MKWLTVLVVSTGINCYLYAATRGNVGIGNAKVEDVRYATHPAVCPVEAALRVEQQAHVFAIGCGVFGWSVLYHKVERRIIVAIQYCTCIGHVGVGIV